MEQSRPMEAILQECLDLAKQNFKEITLLGQNIDAYGRDMVPKRTFADLLVYLNTNLPDKMRIRYVTSHPRYFSDRVIDAVSSLDKVCECFHMPFQAGTSGWEGRKGRRGRKSNREMAHVTLQNVY
jgi:tRNA-2-methylthio-N6-dimethylallyladenosine synthase